MGAHKAPAWARTEQPPLTPPSHPDRHLRYRRLGPVDAGRFCPEESRVRNRHICVVGVDGGGPRFALELATKFLWAPRSPLGFGVGFEHTNTEQDVDRGTAAFWCAEYRHPGESWAALSEHDRDSYRRVVRTILDDLVARGRLRQSGVLRAAGRQAHVPRLRADQF